jgi:hypothetical protein
MAENDLLKQGLGESAKTIGESRREGKRPKKIHGANYKPSTREKRETLIAVLPILKQERNKRAEKIGRYSVSRSKYDREKLNRIFYRMAEGQTAQEAQKAEGLPASTFQDWLESGGGDEAEALSVRQSYARAREALADASFSQALDVPRQLYAIALEGGADMPVDNSTVQAAKLLTDSLKWYAERLAPGRYADKSKAEAPVVNVTNNSLTISGRDLDAGQRDQLRALLTAAQKPTVIEG